MEVEEVQSRSASVVHRNGQNMSAAQTTAAVPGSIASFFGRRAQTTSIYLCLLMLKLSQRGPSTSQPRRLLLRPAQQYLSPQMYQPRRHTDALAAYHPGVVNNLKSQTTTLFITGVRCIPPAHSIPPYQSDSIYSGDFTLVQLSNWYTTVYHPGW